MTFPFGSNDLLAPATTERVKKRESFPASRAAMVVFALEFDFKIIIRICFARDVTEASRPLGCRRADNPYFSSALASTAVFMEADHFFNCRPYFVPLFTRIGLHVPIQIIFNGNWSESFFHGLHVSLS